MKFKSTRKKSILIVNEIMSGGTGNSLLQVLDNIDYEEYDVDLLIISKYGELINNINENVNVKYIFKPLKLNNEILRKIWATTKRRLLYRLSDTIKKVKFNKAYDIEIAWTQGLATVFVSKFKTSAKKIAWVHSDMKKVSLGIKERSDEVYNSFDNVICVSKDGEKIFNQLYPSLKEKTHTIYNIVDREKIIKLSKEKINYNNEDNIVTIVGVGRLAIEKRFDILIHSNKYLKERGIDVKTLIIGDGSERVFLESKIKEFNLMDNVILVGYKSNPYPYIKKADIFVLTSEYEGLPLVIGEAMVLGKPIVATNCTGTREVLNENYGILVPFENPKKVADAIEDLIKNKKKREFYEKRSIERSNVFNKEIIMKQIYQLLQ